MNYVEFFKQLGKEDIPIAGGKGANLGELTNAGIPVPPGFVITSETYRKFITDTGIVDEINNMLANLDINDTPELQRVSKDIKDLITNTNIPEGIQRVIIEAYNKLNLDVGLDDDVVVAIRSSATAEDLPDASFAGQQETYLNISGIDDVLLNVRKCWASLFEARAIFYRAENDFDHSQVLIAVVVQQMVNSEKAGVMFTVDPSTGAEEMLIEGAWGLGEGVVSGTVTPDTCRYDKINDEVKSYKINTKKTMFTKNPDTGATEQVEVPDDLRDKQVLNDSDLEQLTTLGRRIQKHYKAPMDTEWGIENGKVYMLQARPITTLDDISEDNQESLDESERVILLKGLGASPGLISGTVKIVRNLDELDKILDGDILVTTMTTPDMVPAMKRANGIVTDEGGVTCHAAIISRELGIPCVSGTGEATKTLKENSKVTIDGKKGLVFEGVIESQESESSEEQVVSTAAPLVTVTDVKVNVSMAEAAQKAYQTGADGVGLLRTEHMMLASGVHPYKFIEEGREDELIKTLVDGVLKVVDVFYPKTVWYRTLDAPTDEFKTLDGGQDEPEEANPMLGWRGIRRELDQKELLKAEFKAIKKLHEQGYTNIGIMLPLLNRPSELHEAKEIAKSVGLIPHQDIDFGMMVETPASAIIIEDFIDEGLDFISFGTNDLTQYTLALDRNNELVAPAYNEGHPAVLKLVMSVIKKCKAAGVTTSICGQAGSKPEIVEKLVMAGIDSVSANTDAVPTIRKLVAKIEKKIMLDAARKTLYED